MRPARTPKKPSAIDARMVRRLRRELVESLTARLGDAALAEDLTQETLIQVLRGSAGREEVTTRARKIAGKLAAEHEAREGEWSGDPRLGPESLEGQGAVPTPLDLLEQRIAHECLVGAFGRLPIDARRLIMLHDLEEIPLREIAATFGCSATSAKVRLRRARIRLSEICRADAESEIGPDAVLLCLAKEGTPLGSYGATGGRPPRRRRPRTRRSPASK
jgi:RNA polymerase sigma factor (sigma-70 family)